MAALWTGLNPKKLMTSKIKKVKPRPKNNSVVPEIITEEQKLYPSPRPSNSPFSSYWNILISEIVPRENFKRGHLLQLKILCDLYCEKDNLDDTIDLMGTTYITGGDRHGDQEKIRPEVLQRNQVVRSIHMYTKVLGLILYKDTETGEGETSENWD